MATWTTWAAELTRFRNARASQGTEFLLKKAYTDARGNKTEFKSLQDIMKYDEFLEQKANAEASSDGARSFMMGTSYDNN